jgi:DNA polymerase III subunit epsilon
MREIVLDTETTGLDPETGDRIVEIGAVELWNHLPTGRTYHQYVNPERAMPLGAFEVHGLSDEFLIQQPLFAAVSADFLNFVGDARLVIHNAEFDIRFLNHEFGRCRLSPFPLDRAIDTLAIARRRFPGSPTSLDALCRRFGIDTSARTLHGALLDSQILAEVYLELVGGRQPIFAFDLTLARAGDEADSEWRPRSRPAPLPPLLTESESAAHAAFVRTLGEAALWQRFS